MNANEFIAGLAPLQRIAPLEPDIVASKCDLLAAEGVLQACQQPGGC